MFTLTIELDKLLAPKISLKKIWKKSGKIFKILEIYQNIKPKLINLTGIYKIFQKSNMSYSK
jgi:hypothetical protein